MGTKITYAYCELLQGLYQNTWLYSGEGQKLLQLSSHGTEEECKEAYFRYKQVIADRLGYWESMQ